MQASPAPAGMASAGGGGYPSRMTNLLHEAQDGIVILTLNRPDKLNALDYALIDALAGALDELEADGSCRGVILTGAGERAFSAGADISEFAKSVEAGVEVALRDFVDRGQRLTRRIERYTHGARPEWGYLDTSASAWRYPAAQESGPPGIWHRIREA